MEMASIYFEEYTLLDRPHPAGMGGRQIVLRFPNDYGASVISFPGSYGYDEGLMELAVIHFPEGSGDDDFNLIYDTPITDDVIGHLSAEGIKDTCHQIMALPERITA